MDDLHKLTKEQLIELVLKLQEQIAQLRDDLYTPPRISGITWKGSGKPGGK